MTRVIPRTSIWEKYDCLRDNKSQKERLAVADEMCKSPETLAEMFRDSIEQFKDYDNREEAFYPTTRSQKDACREVSRTNDVVLRLREQKRLVPVDASDRRLEHDAGPSVVAVPSGALVSDYVDREILVQRTTGTRPRKPAAEKKGEKTSSGLRLDVLLVDAADQTPIVGELKLPGDMDPFFALFQALACAAHLSTTYQYERMRRHFPQAAFPERTSPPNISIWILFADSSTRQQSRKGTKMRQLEAAADLLAPRLLAQDCIRTLRRIVAVNLKHEQPTSPIVPEVRWAWERQ